MTQRTTLISPAMQEREISIRQFEAVLTEESGQLQVETLKLNTELEHRLQQLVPDTVIQYGVTWFYAINNLLEHGFFHSVYNVKHLKPATTPCTYWQHKKHNETDLHIMCGFALHDNGIWKPHTWLTDDCYTTIEVTAEHLVAYYGYRLTRKKLNYSD